MIPKLNDNVRCPPDRGDAAYSGKVTHVGQKVERNIDGVPYVWTEVRRAEGSKHVWPSHRIGYKLTAEEVASLEAPVTPAVEPAAAPAPARRMRP